MPPRRPLLLLAQASRGEGPGAAVDELLLEQETVQRLVLNPLEALCVGRVPGVQLVPMSSEMPRGRCPWTG